MAGTSPADMQAYLHENIPVSAGMGIRVLETGPGRVRLEAPLEPNENHHATAFGGSVAALAILAGWTLVHLRLRRSGLAATTVIQSSDVHYEAPVHAAFQAVAESPPEEVWERFERTLSRRGKARIHVQARVEAEGGLTALFSGAYVALAPGA